MWHVGIDLHRKTVVLAAVNDVGEAMNPVTIPCTDTATIVSTVSALGSFRTVIEATGTYRWLYNLLRPYGTVLLAHPLRLRAMIQRRTKTDKLDAQLLANLLRINQIPLAYIPPEPYQQLRDLTRNRARLGRHLAEVKIQLRALLARQNREPPYRTPFGPRGLGWFRGQDFGPIENMVRDELLERLRHYAKQMILFDNRLEEVRRAFPQVEALADIYGIGLYSALLIVAEIGEAERFCTAKQVGAYTGLTSRVHQSGGHCYQGSITRQGSPWLRWVLVQAAMKAVRRDAALRNFYSRIRKRSGAKIARVAAARKLAEICWKRLRRWQREHAGQAA
ncbi:MAG: IS110 family transposase [Pirellulales bacterium]|nr:IS110 family transposase [Pirellulales bacterium]